MPPSSSGSPRPLLTLAIPTFNRSTELAALLEILEPQLTQFPQVELLIADNASADDTPIIVSAAAERLAAAGVRVQSHRHPENIGSDANFAFCFQQARGHFFWMCGDDDIIVPGGLALVLSHLQDANGNPAPIDIVYATSYGFREDYIAERQSDPFGRRFHTLRNPRTAAMVINIMFSFISGIVVNKAHLESMPHEDPSAFIGTNLVQLSWALPLLLEHRATVVVWERPVAARQGNAHGYSLGHVFGERLAANTTRLLPNRPDLSAPIFNFALRRWFPSVLIDIRGYPSESLQLDAAHAALRRTFGNNPRYWLFTYPALKLPLPLARIYTRITAAMSKLLYIAHLPGFWRKQTI